MATPYGGDYSRYGYGPEHRFIAPWQSDLAARVAQALAENPITQPGGGADGGGTGGGSGNELPDAGIIGDLATGAGVITAVGGLNRLLGNPIKSLTDSLFDRSTVVGGNVGQEDLPAGIHDDLSDGAEVYDPDAPMVLPDGYSAGQWRAPPTKNILDDDVWARLNEPYNYDPWGIGEATGGQYGSTYAPQYTGGDAGIWGWFDTPHDPNPYGLTGDFGSTYQFSPGEMNAPGLEFGLDDLVQGGGGDEVIEGGMLDDLLTDAGDWASENLLGPGTGPGGSDTLWGFDVANRFADIAGGAAAVYGAVKDPRPDTILQGVGGIAAMADLLPGFGTAYALYNGIIAGMKWLTGAGDKVPWGGAIIPISGGSFAPLEANAGYGGGEIAAKLADKAAKVQAEMMTLADAQGIDLASILGDSGAVQFQPTGTREQPDADRPMVRIVRTAYDDRGSPQDVILGVSNTTRGVTDDPKVMAQQLLSALLSGNQGSAVGGSNTYAEGGLVRKQSVREEQALMDALGISRAEARALLRGSIKDTDLPDFAERVQSDVERRTGRPYRWLMNNDNAAMVDPYWSLPPGHGMDEDGDMLYRPPGLPEELKGVGTSRAMRGGFANGGFVVGIGALPWH